MCVDKVKHAAPRRGRACTVVPGARPAAAITPTSNVNSPTSLPTNQPGPVNMFRARRRADLCRQRAAAKTTTELAVVAASFVVVDVVFVTMQL